MISPLNVLHDMYAVGSVCERVWPPLGGEVELVRATTAEALSKFHTNKGQHNSHGHIATPELMHGLTKGWRG